MAKLNNAENWLQNRRDLTNSVQRTIYFGFTDELWVFALGGFQLNGNFLASGHIRSVVDISERTASNLPSQPKLFANSKFHAYSQSIL